MHWIIQENLYNELAFNDLVDTLERFGIPYTNVKVEPRSEGLPLIERVHPLVFPEGPVIAMGSVALARIGAEVGWKPGSFYNDNHDFRVWNEKYGKHMLNSESIVCRFGDVEQTWDQFFIRPCGDTKTFNGQCLDWMQFKDFRDQVHRKEVNTLLDDDTMVMYGPIKNIYRECRFFVLDKKIVTQSTYKIGDRIHYTEEVPPTTMEYAKRMIDIWQPARGFVMDIALTDDADDGYNKIVEINCLNCSGFYDIDVQKLVMALETMDD